MSVGQTAAAAARGGASPPEGAARGGTRPEGARAPGAAARILSRRRRSSESARRRGAGVRSTLGRWASAVALGAAVGLGVTLLRRLELLAPASSAAVELAGTLDVAVGPVWIPMLAVALRVAWLVGGALLTRSGRGALGRPVRPELVQLAPLFAALGLAGTVWGLRHAFDALQDGQFLARLPSLLGGLGAAMTSTLVGLALQVVTLLAATFSPAWSHVRVDWAGGDDGVARFALDRRALGEGESGFGALVDSLRARQPEALRVAFACRVPGAQRGAIAHALWERIDSAIPLREVVR